MKRGGQLAKPVTAKMWEGCQLQLGDVCVCGGGLGR